MESLESLGHRISNHSGPEDSWGPWGPQGLQGSQSLRGLRSPRNIWVVISQSTLESKIPGVPEVQG